MFASRSSVDARIKVLEKEMSALRELVTLARADVLTAEAHIKRTSASVHNRIRHLEITHERSLNNVQKAAIMNEILELQSLPGLVPA